MSRCEEERKKIYDCIARLAHAKQCDNPYCSVPGCFNMKIYVHHFCDCFVGCKGGCCICVQLMGVCVYHTKTCRNKSCGVPFCPEIKAEKVKMSKVPAKTRKSDKSKQNGPATTVDTVSNYLTSSSFEPNVPQSQTPSNGLDSDKSASLSTKQINSKEEYGKPFRKSLDQLSDAGTPKQRDICTNASGSLLPPIHEPFSYEFQEQFSDVYFDNVMDFSLPYLNELINFLQEISRDPVMRGAFEEKYLEILTMDVSKPLTTFEDHQKDQVESPHTRPRPIHVDELRSSIPFTPDHKMNNFRQTDPLLDNYREQFPNSNNNMISTYLVDPFMNS